MFSEREREREREIYGSILNLKEIKIYSFFQAHSAENHSSRGDLMFIRKLSFKSDLFPSPPLFSSKVFSSVFSEAL
jgi:N-dimethylarginine dimethylaminohydrolase